MPIQSLQAYNLILNYLYSIDFISKMSKSPAHRNQHAYRPEYSPFYQPEKSEKKDKLYHPSQTTFKTSNRQYLAEFDDNNNYRQTQKKKYDQTGRLDVQTLLQRVKVVSNENAELYRLLEERGRIIVVLQKKLQEQAKREGKLLSEQKNREWQEAQLKVIEYQKYIQSLKKEVSQLKNMLAGQNLLMFKEIDKFKDTLNLEKKYYQRALDGEATARCQNQEETRLLRGLVDVKALEMTEMNTSYFHLNEKLKVELANLQTQLIQMSHRYKVELAEQKMMFEHRLDSSNREHIHQIQLLTMQHSIEIKNLQSLFLKKESDFDRLKEQKEADKNQQNNRYQELTENNQRLERQIEELQQHSKNYINEQKVKWISVHQNEVKALKASHQVVLKNLEGQLKVQEDLIVSKSFEIDKLFKELSQMKSQHLNQNQKNQEIIRQQKEELVRLQTSHSEESERLKVRVQELRNADVAALKLFYQHEIQMLNEYLHEQMELYQKQKESLYQQVNEKSELRKNFDLELLALNLRISELQAKNKELLLMKKEELESANEKIQRTEAMLIKEIREREQLNASNQEEKRSLQVLIKSKDGQIEQLNKKIDLLKQNHAGEIKLKEATIVELQKVNEWAQSEAKKEKYFYQNELRKKQSAIKTNKDIYNAQLERLKNSQKQQFDQLTKELSTACSASEIELNRYRSNEKFLISEWQNKTKEKEAKLQLKIDQLTEHNKRLTEQKDAIELRLSTYFQGQTKKLTLQLQDLNKKLSYKQNELMNAKDKYHRLEQRVDILMTNQERLHSIQSKVAQLNEQNFSSVNNTTEKKKILYQ